MPTTITFLEAPPLTSVQLSIIAWPLNTHSLARYRMLLLPVSGTPEAVHIFDLTSILDLYLIDPPPGAPHTPVDPAHIVIAGDSAGGGLSLSLLQVIRDAKLPAPAGGILISPWCDLTHSFPSIHTNTGTVRETSHAPLFDP